MKEGKGYLKLDRIGYEKRAEKLAQYEAIEDISINAIYAFNHTIY